MNKRELEERIIQTKQKISISESNFKEFDKDFVVQPNIENQFFIIKSQPHTGKIYNYRLNTNDVTTYFDNNNYFTNSKRAAEVANKVNLLLKLEKYYDTYCPNYYPNWDSEAAKYYIYYDSERKRFKIDWDCKNRGILRVYFPNRETAQIICDKLNEDFRRQQAE